MKRLLIYLGLLATLLAMPYHAKADNMWLRFWNGTEKVVEMHHDGGGTAWHYDFYTTDDYWKNNGIIYVYPKVNNSISLKSPNSANQGTNASGAEYEYWKAGGDNKYDYKITLPTDYATKKYKVTVWVTNYNQNQSDPYCKVKVTWEKADFNLQLKSSLDNWISSTPSESSTGYTWTWDKSTLSSISSGSKISFKLYDADEDKWYGVSGSSDTEATSSWQSCVEGGSNWYVTYSKGNTYTIDAQRVNGTWQVKVTTNEEDHDYYWVSPQVTNNQKLPYFKLVPSRNRWRNGGDGKISSKYYTFTIQDEFIKQFNGSYMPKDTQIQWYIVRDDGNVFYRPTSELPVDDTPKTYDANHGGSGTLDSHVSYKNYWGEGYGDYMTTDATRSGSFSFSKGSAKAYTFNLNAEKGHVFFNYTTASGDTNIDYYLIGNFTSAKGEVDIPIGDTSHPMTKWYYKGDLVTQSPVADADSIVYKVNVTKPAEGWGDLYIDINPSGNTDWKDVIRPLINLGNNLDGRALHGGLVVNNSNQSLNPETSDDYTSYTFSFNATTFTYRLEFHTSLYLVGPGVSATEGMGSWNISNPSTSDPRIRLTPTQETDHYRNLVYFTQGQPFRFIKNTDESTNLNYAYTWYENDNKPKWVSAASDADYYAGSETQFCNYIQYESDGSESNMEPKDATTNSMTFDLPTGWYYVNFYPNAATPYYTIEHSMELRDFNEVYYRAAGIAEQRNVNGRNDYNFLRVWSDHIAWNKPDNIDVFVVSAFGHNAETHETTATLTKLDVDYIPAKTGVILGCKLSKDNLSSGLVYDNAATLAYDKGENVNYYNTLTAELTPYSAPSTSYDETSKLIPLYEETSLQRFSDKTGIGTGDGYANYLFGFYRCKKYQQNYSGHDNDFQMGFWLTTGNGTTYANSAFLHLTKAQAEDLGVGTAYNNIESASAPAFMLLFDESDDNVITGISDITTAKGNSVASQGWYTLQGVRTAKPTQRGIYIYNGKKVIVND